jgi:predicted MFS family arabinose efflux permease
MLLATSLIARLPLAALGIALLVHAQHLTGSFATGGAVTGAYAAGCGVGGPLLARLVDRGSHSVVLITSACASAVLLGLVAALPTGVAAGWLVASATMLGLLTPPIGSCVRALLPHLVANPAALRSAYALESSALELTFVFGPPLALGLGAAWSTGAALASAGVVLAGATVAFAVSPHSKRPSPRWGGTGPGCLRPPAMRVLVLTLLAIGVLFGSVEIGVVAAAAPLGGSGVAGLLLGAWGAGSLAGGLLSARRGGTQRSRGLIHLVTALALTHATLAACSTNRLALAALLVVAGATIAPTYASLYALVEHLTPPGTITEAFAWLATAIVVGESAGAAGAGMLAGRFTPAATFVLAGAAGLLAVALLAAGARSLHRALKQTYPRRTFEPTDLPSVAAA